MNLIDIGDSHWLSYFRWAPDRELNPQYADIPDLEKAGAQVYHFAPIGRSAFPSREYLTKRTGLVPPEGMELCVGAVNFDYGPDSPWRGLYSNGAHWQVQSIEPLTISPSVLCVPCGDHGFIREGRWVRA